MPGDSNSKFTITCDLPDRSGYQVIAAEWNVGDTAASFLNVVDVDFTDEYSVGTIVLPSGDTDNGGGIGGLQEYNPNMSYPNRGTEVIYEGKVYASKWWVNPGQIPGAEQWGPWEYIRDYEQTNPSDRFPVEMNTFTINNEDVRQGDRVILQVSKDGVMKEYDLVTVPQGMSANDLIKEMTAKINQISSQELNDSIIAGVKDNNGDVLPNDELVSIYQVAAKPYSDISFQYYQGAHHLKNELHLMDFEDQYDLNSDGSVNITAKIMYHASDTTNVFVTLQDSSGKAVNDKRDIQIDSMQTYNLSLTAHNLQPGEYDLIIGSVLQGAQTWQKDMKINLVDPSADDIVNLDKVTVNMVSNTPYYVVGSNDSVRPKYAPTELSPLGMHPDKQVTILPWNKATAAYGNNKADYVKCSLPSGSPVSVTYQVSGNLNSVTCKIK
ncbi:hypothetical protein fh0823_27490 [Francisella halioticida]|uniref:lytic polysaccharide monooxygenase n=1 Tax=Francisella halioticida TaxID=549298 RepID=UPI001AF1E10E|nr:lytic polysaccharide monooxygenase [Francisella halioticida]BCD92610.1 hypothetical protein fh0823_27490 [Francisella halioticida]